MTVAVLAHTLEQCRYWCEQWGLDWRDRDVICVASGDPHGWRALRGRWVDEVRTVPTFWDGRYAEQVAYEVAAVARRRTMTATGEGRNARD